MAELPALRGDSGGKREKVDSKSRPTFLPTANRRAFHGQIGVGHRRDCVLVWVYGCEPVQETVPAEGKADLRQKGKAQMAESAASASYLYPGMGFVMSLAFSNTVGVDGWLETTRTMTWNLIQSRGCPIPWLAVPTG